VQVTKTGLADVYRNDIGIGLAQGDLGSLRCAAAGHKDSLAVNWRAAGKHEQRADATAFGTFERRQVAVKVGERRRIWHPLVERLHKVVLHRIHPRRGACPRTDLSLRVPARFTIVSGFRHQGFHDLIDREARRFLAWREFLEAFQPLSDDRLRTI